LGPWCPLLAGRTSQPSRSAARRPRIIIDRADPRVTSRIRRLRGGGGGGRASNAAGTMRRCGKPSAQDCWRAGWFGPSRNIRSRAAAAPWHGCAPPTRWRQPARTAARATTSSSAFANELTLWRPANFSRPGPQSLPAQCGGRWPVRLSPLPLPPPDSGCSLQRPKFSSFGPRSGWEIFSSFCASFALMMRSTRPGTITNITAASSRRSGVFTPHGQFSPFAVVAAGNGRGGRTAGVVDDLNRLRRARCSNL